MQNSTHTSLKTAVSNYNPIIVIISPPRCSSTAFSRTFWQLPAIRYYAHEPFEVTYYQNQGIDRVMEQLQNPLDLTICNPNEPFGRGTGLVIKEMPYQVGSQLSLLLEIATGPIIFLIRDPRLNIASRMEKKQEHGDSPFYPPIESGWDLLKSQIDQCKSQQIPYMVVDAIDFRNRPEPIFAQVYERLGLTFQSKALTWQSRGDIELDNLGGDHSHLYRHVLTSTRMEPEVDPVPTIESFPTEHGWRDHVIHCLSIYNQIRNDNQRIK